MSELMDRAVIGMPYEMAMEGEVARRQFYSRAQSLLAEVQVLRDQVAALQSAESSYQSGYDDGRRMGTKHRQSEVEQLTRGLEVLRARVVVVPERKQWGGLLPTAENLKTDGFNDCLDALARLNGKSVSEGLLRRIVTPALTSSDAQDRIDALEQVRAMLGEGKEVGNG